MGLGTIRAAMAATPSQEILRRAVAQLGGVGPAARHLGLRPGVLELLLDGSRPVPDALLLKALDAAQNAASLPAVAPVSPPPKGPPVI